MPRILYHQPRIAMNDRDSMYDRPLADGWMIRPSSEVEETPARVSGRDFRNGWWHPTSVPSTVLAALVDNGVHADPYFGMNLKNIPTEQFARPWWYRTQFQLIKLQLSHP